VSKDNCWEFMKCGREIGGSKVSTSGVCPVAAEKVADGLNGGVNAGRICWVMAENGCKGKVESHRRRGKEYCFQCQFRYLVLREEGLLNVCKATGALLSQCAHQSHADS